MNFFVDNDSDLEEEQLNLFISGPSKSPQKTKNEKPVWDEDNSEIGNSLVNIRLRKDIIVKGNKDEKFKKYKNKTNDVHKTKNNANTKIKQLLSDRLKMYIIAEENARKLGETRRGRNLNKKIQILNALITHHDTGNIIDPDNIPPEIDHHGSKSMNPHLGVTFKEFADITVIPRHSSSETESEANLEKLLGTLRLRRDQYKISVAQNKSAGNVTRALEHLNIVRTFETVIKHLEMGEKVDLDELPGPPEYPICHIIPEGKCHRKDDVENVAEDNSDSSFTEPIISHNTVLQALQDRLRAYEISRMNAKKENNVGQVLHIERIIKVYKDAITLHRTGKGFRIDELPSPPGFAPISNLKKATKFPSNILF